MTDQPSRLARRLGLGDAIVVGLGSMIGAGVFSAIGPAADLAGSGLLVGLAIAGAVAWCNATSSAALAVADPTSGGAYAHGRARLGPVWGFLAGWGFVVGKVASCAAMAMTVGVHVAPSAARLIALASVVTLTAVNHAGVRKTAALTRVVVATVLAALAVVVAGLALGGRAGADGFGSVDARGILPSAGLLFFAFAGYARIATLGEEVVDPATTIPRAVRRALGITLAVYAAVAVAALSSVGPDALARSDAPLAAAVADVDLDPLVPVVRVGAAIAALGVLLSLLAGVSRTAFAMAADRELPAWFDAVHPTRAVPHRAVVAVGAAVAMLVVVVDLRDAIGFSSFCVLTYYAIANAAAWTLPGRRVLAAAGLVGCVLLAVTLPTASVVTGTGVLAVGLVTRRSLRSGASPRRRRGTARPAPPSASRRRRRWPAR